MALVTRVRFLWGVIVAVLHSIVADLERGAKLVSRGPIAGGAPEGEGEGEGGTDGEEKDGEKEAEKGGDAGKEDESDDEDKVGKEDDWQTKARKHENRSKREKKKREEAEEKARKLEERDKTDTEKALDKARKEARDEALSEAEKERRSDRLEVAVTRLASKGLTLGEGDDAETKRFADTDDALLNVERAIAKGDIDEDTIFDDKGKVDTDALKDELADLLRRKPHLAADGGAERRDPGDNDVRKGGAAKSDLEGMSPEDHAKRKFGDK